MAVPQLCSPWAGARAGDSVGSKLLAYPAYDDAVFGERNRWSSDLVCGRGRMCPTPFLCFVFGHNYLN